MCDTRFLTCSSFVCSTYLLLSFHFFLFNTFGHWLYLAFAFFFFLRTNQARFLERHLKALTSLLFWVWLSVATNVFHYFLKILTLSHFRIDPPPTKIAKGHQNRMFPNKSGKVTYSIFAEKISKIRAAILTLSSRAVILHVCRSVHEISAARFIKSFK